MNETLIRVRDFAQNCGCTPQNIYGHLKTYAKELEGHTFQGRGRQGVLLDEYAQDYIRSVMYPKEVSTDVAMAEELEKLRSALFAASQKTTEMAVELATARGELEKMKLEADHNKKLLVASQEAEEARAAEVAKLHEQLQQRDEQIQQKDARYDAVMKRGFWARLTNKEVE